MLCLSFSSFLAYSQSCGGTLGTNLITGGDFGSGPATIVLNDPLLAPGYTYQNNPPPDDGFYTIANTTDFGDPNFCWTSQGDNSTDPNGYLMVVNATFDPGIFFERTLEVCDGINYEFSIDILNLLRIECVDGISPNVDILLDGVVIDQTGNVPQDEAWHTYRTMMTIPEGTDFITFTLRNNAPGGGGNDLGIDNLSLRHCAPNLPLQAITIACPQGVTIEAPAAANAYPTLYYQWQRSFDGGTSWNDLANENNLSYQWPGNGQASCDTCASTNWLALPGGQLQVIVNNPQGCGLVIDTLLEVLNPYRVYQPNAFSPNGDGENDLFMLSLGTNAKAIASLAIFDRWGGAVYQYPEDTPQEAGWDGTRKGQPMPTGIYVYHAEIEFQNGKRKQVQGDLLLMR